ncbi:MAG: hypothetical protein GQ570_12235 [Helicobacteraceae bacterium]|nr:hypothetical protein [Helicobacteraceae bacterium]
MGKLDKEKEEIGWIKFWIGVSVASIMGLISWFVNNYESANELMLFLDIISVLLIAVFIVILNKIGLEKIKELEDI